MSPWQRLRRCLALDSTQLEHRILRVLALQGREDALSTPVFGLVVALLLTVEGSPVRVAEPPVTWLWFCGLCVWAIMAAITSRAFRNDQASRRKTVVWRYRFVALYVANAGVWSALVFVDMWRDNPAGEAFVLLVMLGLLMAYMVNVSPHAPSLLAANVVVFIVGMSSVAIQDGDLIQVVRFIYPLFAAFLLIQGFRSHRRYADSVVREMKMTALADELSQAHRRVQQESQAKSEFFATMSHELRTPLNAITGFADIMGQEMFGPLGHDSYREYASDIRISSNHMLHLVEQLLSLADLEAGHVALQEGSVSTSTLLSAVGDALHSYAQEAGVTIEVHDATGCRILVDRRRLEQAILRVATVLCDSVERGRTVEVRGIVRDTGEFAIAISGVIEGLIPETLAPLIDPFRKGDSWVTQGDFRSGLGLMVSQRLSELHDGRIEIENRQNQATETRICLPLERVLVRDDASDIPQQISA